ncbi:hypothetical protein [Piscirickettsia salmonis]|uniref:hypothetical protein n=1 Tax=Piscirickettsia salmonis TaxID=1238 RepID=UPI0007C945E4|nr:hypothetical protein A0O36_02427 [Piscirickettsiaceae bacterium NZ-RLO1]
MQLTPNDPNAAEQAQRCLDALNAALINTGQEGNKPFDTRDQLAQLSNEVISSVGGMLSYIQMGIAFLNQYGCCFSAASQINPEAGELYNSAQDISSQVEFCTMQIQDIASTVRNNVEQIQNV